MSRQYICPGCQRPQTVHPCPACNPNYGFKRMDPEHVRRAREALNEATVGENLTPEQLRGAYVVPYGDIAADEQSDLSHVFADAWVRDHREIERLRAERDALLRWLRQHPQPHPELCEGWGWAKPLGESALKRCDCGLAKALAATEPPEKRDD